VAGEGQMRHQRMGRVPHRGEELHDGSGQFVEGVHDGHVFAGRGEGGGGGGARVGGMGGFSDRGMPPAALGMRRDTCAERLTLAALCSPYALRDT
jgi:hypothetical protein